MKVVVLGADLIGKEIARDLATNDFVERIFLADTTVEKYPQLTEQEGTDKIKIVTVDAANDENLREVLKIGDLVVNTLGSRFNERIVKAALEVCVHVIDLGGHIEGVTPNLFRLNDEAQAKGIMVISGLEIAPGIINIVTGYGASKLDHVESIKLYVGGISTQPKQPLHYTNVFSLENTFNHYTEPSKAIQQGVLTEVAPLSGVESIYFDEFGVLEAFYTSGGISTLYKTFPNVKTLEYKTIRYKGHAEKLQLLAQLGFLDSENTVIIDGQELQVRTVIREALKKKLELGEKEDAVLLRAIIVGDKNEEQVTYEYEMVAKKERQKNRTVMAHVTASTVSSTIQLIVDGKMAKYGIYPSEQIIPGDLFMEEVKKRGITIKETCHYSTTIVKW